MSVRRLTRLSILLASLLLYAGQVLAGAWQQAVTSRISTEYDTNPAMSPTYPGSVWRHLLEPSYTISGRVGANDLKTGLAIQLARSSNKMRSQNRDSPSVFIDWSRPSEVGEFGINYRYAEIATRDAGIDATGLVSVNSTRTSRTLSGRWTKALSERSTLSADGAYEAASYKGGALVDYVTRSGGALFNYALSEHSASWLKVSYTEYRTVGVASLRRNANAILGWNWKPADYLDLTLQAGKSKVSGVPLITQGSATMQYVGLRNQLSFKAGRQVTPSGLGGFVTSDQVNGGWSYDLGENSKVGIKSGWQKNRSITDDVNRTSEVWLQHNLNSFLGMRTNCQHKIHEGSGIDDVSSNILGLSIVYTNPDF